MNLSGRNHFSKFERFIFGLIISNTWCQISDVVIWVGKKDGDSDIKLPTSYQQVVDNRLLPGYGIYSITESAKQQIP